MVNFYQAIITVNLGQALQRRLDAATEEGVEAEQAAVLAMGDEIRSGIGDHLDAVRRNLGALGYSVVLQQ